jgi:DNA repair protein RadC
LLKTGRSAELHTKNAVEDTRRQSNGEYVTLIRDLPHGERPRERLRDVGANGLSNSELLAILLRTGSEGESVLALATRMLAQFGGLAGLGRTSYAELCSLHGISDAKACQVLAALELARRLSSLSPEDRARIGSPRDVYNLVSAEMTLLAQEHLRVVLLNTKNDVLGVREVYKGNVNSAVVRVAEVLRPAVRENCPAIVIVHNHPSGDPTPSPEDVLVTRRIRTSAELMDIEVLDHVIVGASSFVSLKDKGLGF